MRNSLFLSLVLLLALPIYADKPLENFETYPGFGFQVFQTPAQWQANLDSVFMSFSVDSVTGRSALKLSFPKCEGVPGRIVRAGTAPNFQNAKGISFWVKGDGSRNYGIVALAQKIDAPKARFPLRDTKWHRVILPWNRFRPYAAAAPLLSFGLDPGAARPSYYIIDKVEALDVLASSPDDVKLAAVANTATFPPDPVVPDSFERFFAFTGYLATAKLDLKAHKPVTILVIGDLVGRGDKLYNIDTDDSAQLLYKYPAVLGALLAEKFGYDSHPVVSETLRVRTGREVVAFGGLRIVSACADARAALAVDRLRAQLNREKPSLVVIQLGSADSLLGSSDAMAKGLSDCIDLVKAAKINCMVLTNVPGYMRTAEEEPFAAAIRKIAADSHVALVDVRKCFIAPPPNAWSVYFLDRYVPNYMGHRLIARMIAGALQ